MECQRLAGSHADHRPQRVDRKADIHRGGREHHVAKHLFAASVPGLPLGRDAAHNDIVQARRAILDAKATRPSVIRTSPRSSAAKSPAAASTAKLKLPCTCAASISSATVKRRGSATSSSASSDPSKPGCATKRRTLSALSVAVSVTTRPVASRVPFTATAMPAGSARRSANVPDRCRSKSTAASAMASATDASSASRANRPATAAGSPWILRARIAICSTGTASHNAAGASQAARASSRLASPAASRASTCSICTCAMRPASSSDGVYATAACRTSKQCPA